MLNNLSDREKLYDDIRRECEVSFDGGVCLELLIDEVDNKKLKNLLEEYIIKTCNEFYKKTFKKSDNFLKEYKNNILNLPNRTPNGAFYPKVENVDVYNKIQSHINDILIKKNLVNQFSSFDLTTVRIVDGKVSNADSRLSATSRLHSDAWAGHKGDAILTIGVLGDKTTSLEFNKVIGEVQPSFFDTQPNYSNGQKTFTDFEHISNLKFGTITIFDHACLHRTLKNNGGLRVSIDIGLKLKSSDGILKQKDSGRKMSQIDISEILKVGKKTFVKSNETLQECYNRFKDDKYDKIPVSYIHDTIEIG